MTAAKLIRADMIVAFQQGEHRLLRNGCVVVEGDRITHVGPQIEGVFDEVLEFPNALLTPGMIDMHAHLTSASYDRSYVEDIGKPGFWFSGLPELLPAMGAAIGEAEQRAAVDYSMAELTRNGTTTVFEIGWLGDYTAEAVERAGLRAYIGEGYGSAKWRTLDGKRMSYDWKPDGGLEGLEAAIGFVERVEGRANSRIRGMLTPMQVAMVTPELLQRTRAAAAELGVPVTLHTAEAVFEFHEIVQREGMTPVQWLAAQDSLNERTILGHCVFTSGNSWIQHPGNDLALLADSGASVAHCPWVFARRGIAMESFASYVEAGITMCLGSDTAPQSILHAMRHAAIISKLQEHDCRRPTAMDVFNAATLAPARVLGREDLGRIAPGAKADLLMWDMNGFSMVPCRDPIRNLVYYAGSEDLHHVMVDGDWLMTDKTLLKIDEASVRDSLAKAAQRIWEAVGPGDWAARGIDELSPQSLKAFQ